MTKPSIGMVLSQLLKEANLSPIHIAERMNKTRQNIYLDLKRTSMRDEQIQDWAKALGIDKQVIYNRANDVPVEQESNYIVEQLKSWEEQFKRLINQLEVKDRQIEGLQQTVTALLGKSDVSESSTRDTISLVPHGLVA